MHRCLQIPEIFLMILDSLPEDQRTEEQEESDDGFYTGVEHEYRARPRGSEYLHLALTCKTFLEPALDALWHTIRYIDTLLTVWYPDGVREWEELYGGKKPVFPIPIQSFNASRLSYYARRIRVLHVNEELTSGICRIMSISFPASVRPIFPNLRYLSFYSEGAWRAVSTLFYIGLFSGPSLQSLRLHPSSESSADAFLCPLSMLAAHSPSLTHVTFKPEFPPDCDQDPDSEITHILTSFPYLTSVNIHHATTPDAITCLAGMPRLRSLVLNSSRCARSWSSHLPSLPSFESLQQITLLHGYLQDYIALFRSFDGRRDFSHIKLEYINIGTAPQLEDLFKSIHGACSPMALQELCIIYKNEGEDPDGPGPMELSNTSLSPLLVFRHLGKVTIGVWEADWDDRLLEEISNCWPNLRELRLYDSRFVFGGAMTVGGLYPIARNCRHLQSLSVPLQQTRVRAEQLPRRNRVKLTSRQCTIFLDSYRNRLTVVEVSYLRDLFHLPDAAARDLLLSRSALLNEEPEALEFDINESIPPFDTYLSKSEIQHSSSYLGEPLTSLAVGRGFLLLTH